MVTVIIPVHRFNEITDTDLTSYAQNKVEKLDGNAKYPAPFPELAVVSTLIAPYSHAVAKAIDGNKADTQLKEDLRDQLERALTYLAWACSVRSVLNIEMFLESGFDYRKRGNPIEKLAPTALAAYEGNEDSSILVTWSKTAAASYVVQITENVSSEASWKDVGFPTASEYLVRNLVKGKQYWFRVAAVYAAGLSDWSDPATRIAV